MDYTKKPVFHFRSADDTGVDELPSGAVVFVENFYGASKILKVSSNNGATSTMSVYSAAAAGYLIPFGDNYFEVEVHAPFSDFNASPWNYYYVDNSGGESSFVLPETPSNFDKIKFIDHTGSFGQNKMTIKINPNTSHTIMGVAEDMEVTDDNVSFGLVYINSDWRIF